MLISCPKCNSVYNISADKVSPNGKKFKCAECGQIWTVYPQDVNDIEPENVEVKPQMNAQEEAQSKISEAEIEEMFQRLSKDTKGLFNTEIEKKEGTFLERFKRKVYVFMTPTTVIGFLFIISSVLALTIMYRCRYSIVSRLPMLENLYADIRLDSVYEGKELKFEDIHIRHFEEGGQYFVEVSGALFNRGKYITKLLPIAATLTDQDGRIVSTAQENMPHHNLESGFSAMFRIVLDNPTTQEKQLTLKLFNSSGE